MTLFLLKLMSNIQIKVEAFDFGYEYEYDKSQKLWSSGEPNAPAYTGNTQGKQKITYNVKKDELSGGKVEVELIPDLSTGKINGKISAYGLTHELLDFDLTFNDLVDYFAHLLPVEAVNDILYVIKTDLTWANIRDALFPELHPVRREKVYVKEKIKKKELKDLFKLEYDDNSPLEADIAS